MRISPVLNISKKNRTVMMPVSIRTWSKTKSSLFCLPQVECSGTFVAMLAMTVSATMPSSITDVQTTELVKWAPEKVPLWCQWKKVDVQLVGDMVVTCLDVVKVNMVELVDVKLV